MLEVGQGLNFRRLEGIPSDTAEIAKGLSLERRQSVIFICDEPVSLALFFDAPMVCDRTPELLRFGVMKDSFAFHQVIGLINPMSNLKSILRT